MIGPTLGGQKSVSELFEKMLHAIGPPKATWGISPTVILVIGRFLSNFNRSSISGMDAELHILVAMRLPC